MAKKPEDEAARQRKKDHTRLDKDLDKAVKGQKNPRATDAAKNRHAAKEAETRAALNKLKGM